MASPMIRISARAHQTLADLAKRSGESMLAVLDRAVEAYRRQQFMTEFNAAYAALRADPVAWAEIEKERALWDGTLMDGLDPNEVWTEDGNIVG